MALQHNLIIYHQMVQQKIQVLMLSPNISSTPFSVGSRPDGTLNFWQGDIAEANRVYSGKQACC
jgi:hypothetical protein